MSGSRYLELVGEIEQEVANVEQYGPACLGGLSLSSARRSSEAIRELLSLVGEMAEVMQRAPVYNTDWIAVLQKAREATGAAQ